MFFLENKFKKKQRTEWYSRKKKFDERYKHSLPATVRILITGNYPNRARCHRRRAQWWYHITVVFLFSAWTSFIKLAENYLHPCEHDGKTSTRNLNGDFHSDFYLSFSPYINLPFISLILLIRDLFYTFVSWD